MVTRPYHSNVDVGKPLDLWQVALKKVVANAPARWTGKRNDCQSTEVVSPTPHPPCIFSMTISHSHGGNGFLSFRQKAPWLSPVNTVYDGGDGQIKLMYFIDKI